MVKKIYPNVIVLPLADTRSDLVWSQNLDHLLSITFSKESFVLYGSRDSFIKNYSGKYEVSEIEESNEQSATNLREQMSDKVMDTKDFRCGIIYAYSNTYPKVYPTLDVALFRNDYSDLLLGRRDAEGLWRLPGGFSDPTDANYEAAALRELKEECGDIEVDNLNYEGSFKVDDWRYRNETDKIITLLFSCTHLSGTPQGNDDIDEVRWFSLKEVIDFINTKGVVEEHVPQLQKLIKKYSSAQ
jgi:bifunctional NMN adenylyltransferase/nudix hydrolase